jgi:tRNA(adenine34) deaminase
MRRALAEARAAAQEDEVPVGAVVTRGGEVLSVARNRMRLGHDPTAHAEIVALRLAAEKLGDCRLDGCDLWVTLEPCAMCAGAIALARISRLYFGAADPKRGAVVSGVRLFAQPSCHHAPDVYPGIGESEAGELLRAFFRERR